MAKIEVTIHAGYVPDWGLDEGVREIMQNALDEDDKGNKVYIDHKGDKLTVGNEGSHLKVPDLLLGATDKAGEVKSRGEYGEGLDLGLLALVRGGLNVEVRTPTENWKPALEFSDKWGQEILVVNTRKVNASRTWTEISISGISSDVWERMKFNFLDFHDIDDDKIITESYYGSILLGPEYMGRLYSKGIFVNSDPEMRYGYNFKNVKLDRDRKMVASFDLGYHTAGLFNYALSKRPEMAEIVWDMLVHETKDVQGFGSYYVDSDAKNIVAKMFKEAHGNDAVMVATEEEATEVEGTGREAVVAPRAMREVIRGEVDTPEVVKEQMSKAVLRKYEFSDICSEAFDNLNDAVLTVQEVINRFSKSEELRKELGVPELGYSPETSLINMVKVVEFRKEGTEGRYSSEDGEIHIARDILMNKFVVLRVLTREVGRMISYLSRQYGQTAHFCTVESLWSAIHYAQNCP